MSFFKPVPQPAEPPPQTQPFPPVAFYGQDPQLVQLAAAALQGLMSNPQAVNGETTPDQLKLVASDCAQLAHDTLAELRRGGGS